MCEEVARFVAPTYVGDLFWNMPLKGIFCSVEANVAKVLSCVFFLALSSWLFG